MRSCSNRLFDLGRRLSPEAAAEVVVFLETSLTLQARKAPTANVGPDALVLI